MRAHLGNLLALLGVTFVLLSGAANPDAEGLLVVAAVIAVLVLAARTMAIGARRPVVAIGRRAREHRLGLAVQPSPQHPCTAGRVRSRAPGLSRTVT